MNNTTTYSRIIAGTMTWGNWGKQLSITEMVSLMNQCMENKITSFDHADIYGDYTNEDQFGKAFAQCGIARENVQLISKCGIQFNVKDRTNRVKHYEYGKDYIIASVERSLKLLRTDFLDLLLLHRPSPLMDPFEIAEAIDHLKQQGKIKQFGVSNFTPSQIKLIEKKVSVEANQIEYSLTSNEAMNNGVLDDCIVQDRLAMSWSPLGSYFRNDTPANQRIGKLLKEFTKKYNATEDQLLLAWILKHPSKIHPVVGTATPERLKLAMEAVRIEMDLQDWFILLEANEGHEVA
ncbi:aldo/keto reductase [Maribacter confluentis]|uniref:Aldo/keto reductase n=1 Tax=Maribacter confluentis TaxID=1656093 RepID=A0ABT8RP64_9FLAO|nr:aldo/keto reductase [Maribacter confluentis]MDO1512695.1 aldo/keto reductase [Maribacter confluentis]